MPTEIRYRETEARIDDGAVRAYFDGVGKAAASASYMAHERDMPAAAGRYRFAREQRILAPWLAPLDPTGRALDLGCGAGQWTAFLAERFDRVVAIERSGDMLAAARERMGGHPRVTLLDMDFRTALPEGPFQVIFLGGICMYLDDAALSELLPRLFARLAPGGLVICRESTVRRSVQRAEGRYQAIYRSPERYRALFTETTPSGTAITQVRNDGYDAMNLAGEAVMARRLGLPFLPQVSPTLGALTWWSLRLTAPVSFEIVPWLAERMGLEWPRLSNHFFRLAPPSQAAERAGAWVS